MPKPETQAHRCTGIAMAARHGSSHLTWPPVTHNGVTHARAGHPADQHLHPPEDTPAAFSLVASALPGHFCCLLWPPELRGRDTSTTGMPKHIQMFPGAKGGDTRHRAGSPRNAAHPHTGVPRGHKQEQGHTRTHTTHTGGGSRGLREASRVRAS